MVLLESLPVVVVVVLVVVLGLGEVSFMAGTSSTFSVLVTTALVEVVAGGVVFVVVVVIKVVVEVMDTGGAETFSIGITS